MGMISNINGLVELARTSFVLGMSMKVLPELEKDKTSKMIKLTRLRLYRKFIDNLANRSDQHLRCVKLSKLRNKSGKSLDADGDGI